MARFNTQIIQIVHASIKPILQIVITQTGFKIKDITLKFKASC